MLLLVATWAALLAVGCSDGTPPTADDIELEIAADQQFGHLHDLRQLPPEKPERISHSQDLKNRRDPRHDVDAPPEEIIAPRVVVHAVSLLAPIYDVPSASASLNRFARRSGASRAPPFALS